MTGGATRQLATARWEVVSDAPARTRMRAVLLAVLVVVGLAAVLRLLAGGAESAGQRDRLLQENAGLRTEVARLGAELDVERATRAALDQQVAELHRQVAELERQLAFVNAQRSRSRTATTAP